MKAKELLQIARVAGDDDQEVASVSLNIADTRDGILLASTFVSIMRRSRHFRASVLTAVSMFAEGSDVGEEGAIELRSSEEES